MIDDTNRSHVGNDRDDADQDGQPHPATEDGDSSDGSFHGIKLNLDETTDSDMMSDSQLKSRRMMNTLMMLEETSDASESEADFGLLYLFFLLCYSY